MLYRIRRVITAGRSASVLIAVCCLAACGGGGASNSANSPATSGTPPSSSTTTSVELTLSGTPATSVVAGSAYSFQPSVTQSSGTVTFSITGMPAWATFDATTGTLSGSPTSANEGTSAAITITGTDGGTTASIGPFTIDVTAPTTTPPSTGSATLSWTAPTENTNGTALTDLAGYIIRYGTSLDAMTHSIKVDSAKTTAYEISNLAPGTYYFEVIAYTSVGTQGVPSDIASKTI